MTLQGRQSNGVRNGRWITDYVRARCTGCDWRYSVRTQGAVVSATTLHVQQTGHRVELSRDQWRVAEPEA